MSNIKNQKAPKPNERKAIWEMVIEDMHERNQDGIRKYGTPLQAFNGRDSLTDLYQELLDASVYCRQKIEEKYEIDQLIQHLNYKLDLTINALSDIELYFPESDAGKTAKEVLDKIDNIDFCPLHFTTTEKCGC